MTLQPPTLLPLESFRRIIRMHPYHFWQLADDELVPISGSCDDVLFEEDWQNADAISRGSIREAIHRAERKLADYLGYDVAPRYRVDTAPWPRLADTGQWRRYNVNAAGERISLRLPFGYVQAAGVLTRTLLGTPAVVVTKRPAGLPYAFSLTLATTVTNPDEIAVYFAPADRWDAGAALDVWKVAPLDVSISGGVATIRGNVWQIVKPGLYADASVAETLDPTDASIYAGTLAVYREYIDPSGQAVDTAQATLIWETSPYPFRAAGCCGSSPYAQHSADPAAVGKAIARVGIRDAVLGLVTPAQALYDATAGQWCAVNWSTCAEPDRVEVRYLAGLPLVNGEMSRYWQETVSYMALAELEGPICACEGVRKRLHHWQFDLARSSGADDEAYGAISQEDLSNPFGTRRGHVEAWKRVASLRTMIGLAF